MFGQVWRWAGSFRKTETKIGVPPHLIATRLRQVLSDVAYWREHQPSLQTKSRSGFITKVVSVHPFPNGNGRHSRLMADLFMQRASWPPFTWGRSSLSEPGEAGARYVHSLRAADEYDIAALLAFAHS
jgi:Fic-DOC domain mobile mystery protein B